ncbi:cation acetate symporter [Desertimonas flava]|jgi:cation/acetate symporter|uniref:solute symporter family protein n=1 Tax=Desertimonas flava TaxID=2064846 RepID=UPI000E357084|nr:cation acetate symporter [Desertimonas flava]
MISRGVLAITLVVLLVCGVGLLVAVRPRGGTTLDFYLAGRRVGIVTNACAICGDYFSAASFLGVAAAVYVSGADGVWYATGFAAGFIPVLLFVATPLRRFGEFSIPDFLGRRLDSDGVRLVSVTVVQLVILSYLVPQAVGSGITWELLVGRGFAGLSPYVTGVVASTVAIVGLVALGGMRGTTWSQAFQFLVMLSALTWLTFAVVGAGFDYASAVDELSRQPLTEAVQVGDRWQIEVLANRLEPDQPAYFGEPGAAFGRFGQFALIATLVMGTAGLPHVMNRYFTSATGRAARATTIIVLGLAGVFYSLAVMLGTAARSTISSAVAEHRWLEPLTVEGLLRVPENALLALGRIHGDRFGLGFVAIGALLATMSTVAGLLLASAASWGHDVYERYVNPQATQRQAVRAGRAAVVVVGAGSGVLALLMRPGRFAEGMPSVIASMVTWAFALAGSAITPVLILSVWWRRTTARGAVAGMVTGAAVAIVCFAAGISVGGDGIGRALLTPTLVAAPCAAAVTVLGSLRTSPPDGLDQMWLRLHGTAADRAAVRLARLTMTGVTGRTRRRR